MILDICFICGLAFVVKELIFIISPNATDHSLIAIVGGTALAWLAGFIVPGSPAGLGVRDAVLLFYLEPLVGNSAAAVVVTLRVITIIVDLTLAAIFGLTFLVLERETFGSVEEKSSSQTGARH
jgi:uncharacterized membrane protein YbhN (UPF0104 family)